MIYYKLKVWLIVFFHILTKKEKRKYWYDWMTIFFVSDKTNVINFYQLVFNYLDNKRNRIADNNFIIQFNKMCPPDSKIVQTATSSCSILDIDHKEWLLEQEGLYRKLEDYRNTIKEKEKETPQQGKL